MRQHAARCLVIQWPSYVSGWGDDDHYADEAWEHMLLGGVVLMEDL